MYDVSTQKEVSLVCSSYACVPSIDEVFYAYSFPTIYQATFCKGSACRVEVLTTDENKFVISILSIQLTMQIAVYIKHVSNLIIVAYIVSRMNRMVEFIIPLSTNTNIKSQHNTAMFIFTVGQLVLVLIIMKVIQYELVQQIIHGSYQQISNVEKGLVYIQVC